MRRVLAAAVLVAAMPTAHAQDKGKADFSTNAEFRARYFWMQNPGGNENTLANKNTGEGRFKLNLNYKANEKVSATMTLLHNAEFGQNTNTSSIVDQDHSASVEDGLNVNQAYATWMSSDDLKFMVGRMNYQVGDGALIGINDWEAVPYAFEGVLANWEAEFGKFQFALLKVRNLTGTSSSGDPEQNMYGINFDLKTMPEWLKAVNVHFFKNNSDAVDHNNAGGAAVDGKVVSTTDGLDIMRYGLMAHFGFGPVELKAWWEGQGGKVHFINTGGAAAKTDYDYKGSMMAAELAYNAPNFMGSRFHFMWHKDSGDDNGGDTSLDAYDSYATEKHNSAGAMDLFGWGNLTFMQVGWMMKPQDKTDVGLQYTMLSMTEAKGSFVTGTYGGNLPAVASQNTNNDKLGDEVDLWATHHYDNNLATTLRLGYFMPGDRFEPAAPATKSTDAIMHVMLEGRATF